MGEHDNQQLISLLNLLKKGDMSAFDDFYQLTKRPIYFSILALSKDETVSEDILAETYVKFLSNLNASKKTRIRLGTFSSLPKILRLIFLKKKIESAILRTTHLKATLAQVLKKSLMTVNDYSLACKPYLVLMSMTSSFSIFSAN